MSINIYDRFVSAFGGALLDGTEVSVDDSSLADITAENIQELAGELERLFGVVRGIQQELATSDRPLNLWDNSVTINAGNLADFIGRNNIYSASNDQRVNFVLPAESVIDGQYPVTFEIQHFGGTQRFDTGGGAIGPNNTIRITRPTDYDAGDPSTFLRRDSETGTNIVFSALHQGDTAIITKEDAESPWVVREGSTDPRNAILPSGLFTLNSRAVGFQSSQNGDHSLTGLSLYTPNQGDAFLVTGTALSEDSTFGRAINVGDVIVAKTDSPSELFDENNDDWLLIRDAGSGDLTLTEIRFLSQISESDSDNFGRLEERSDVQDVRVFLSPYPLDHAPFINPSTDPDNPQTGETGEYIGGDEEDTASSDFSSSISSVSRFANEADSTTAPNAIVYIDIDASFDTVANLSDIFLEHIDIDGQVIERFNLNDDFRPVVLTGSSDTYYVFDRISAVDNYSSISYSVGQQLNVILRGTTRVFNLNENINLLSAIPDGGIPSSKLDFNVNALINADHSLTEIQEAKLNGLETRNNPTKWTAGDLYVKANDHASNNLDNYVNVGQQNGIVSEFDHTTTVTFLVPNDISVTGLERQTDNSIKLSVTSIGTLLNRQAFTATLPASSFDINDPIPDIWQVDGTASNTELSGANESFKVDNDNLTDNVIAHINGEVPTYTLPPNLDRLSHDMSVETTTAPTWRALPSPVRTTLTRQFACYWDEDRHVETGNYFDDLTPEIQITGTNSRSIRYFANPDDPANDFLNFPGKSSFIFDDDIRFRNQTGQTTPITDSLTKLIGFSYTTWEQLISSANRNLLTFGTRPMLDIDANGIFVNVGNRDGEQRTRTIRPQLPVSHGQWRNNNGAVVDHFASVDIPSDATGSFTLRFYVRLDDGNGITFGGHSERQEQVDITIPNVETTQSGILQHTFGWATQFGGASLPVSFSYIHSPTDSRIGYLSATPTVSSSSGLQIYNASADYETTETYFHSETFTKYHIGTGGNNGQLGTHQQSPVYNVLVMLRKWREDDTSSDPELAVTIVVNGTVRSHPDLGDVIRLHAPASEYPTNDITIGHNTGYEMSLANIQCYDYDAGHNGLATPTNDELETLASRFDGWLGAFTDSDVTTDRFVFNADIELAQDETFIVRSPDGSRYSITIDNAGTLITTEIV